MISCLMKKKKLYGAQCELLWTTTAKMTRRVTHKKGIHIKLMRRPVNRLFSPKRYSRMVKPTLPEPKNTTVVASQISKECM